MMNVTDLRKMKSQYQFPWQFHALMKGRFLPTILLSNYKHKSAMKTLKQGNYKLGSKQTCFQEK